MSKSDKILYQIRDLEKIVFRMLIKENHISEEDFSKFSPLTPTQMQIIEYILENANSEIYQKDLEKVLNRRRATVSGVLQTMEKNNLIRRVISSNDTRTKKIIINENTKDMFFKHKNRFDVLEKKITEGISSYELEVFSKVIGMMKSNIISMGLEECESDIKKG